MRARRDMSFDEWQQQRNRDLAKAPASGGVRTPLAPAYTPGYGGNIGLPAPQSTPGPALNSKYTHERPDQPDPWIDDVDMGSNWYSPFQPVWPFGPPWVNRPREWDFPTGYNLNYIPQRIQLYGMLRGMRASWGVLATIIETRKDQLLRIPWTIQLKNKPRGESAAVDEMRKFFRRPDGKLSYGQWSRKLLDDLFVIDAPSIYFSRDRRGRPLTAEVLDGATIFPLIDDAGRRPDTVVELDENGIEYLRRQPAFQQIIKGLPMVDMDESELMYVPMRPRPNMPIFGYPPTEQILVEASEAIRKTFYQLDFWREGTIPDLVVTVPDTWTPRQIAMFQAHFDALMSGNLVLKSKVRFLPGGMKPFDIKNSSGESLWSQRDETLIRLACYGYSVSPTPFVKAVNRGTASTAQQTAEEEGLYPLMSWWKDDIIDPIIQERFGYDEVELVFLPRPEVDQEKQAKIHDLQLKSGSRTINEVREERGEEPRPDGDTPLVYTGAGAIPLDLILSGKALPGAPAGPAASGGVDSSSGSRTGGLPPRPVGDAMRGPARPRSASPQPPTPVHKLIPTLDLYKITSGEVQSAADQATGHLDDFSHQQLSSGNYPKGHVWIQGLNISIENNTGSLRGEKDQHGKKWEVRMPSPYGYIRGTVGADGDQVDVYLGRHPESATVWVIDQRRVSKKGKGKGFDEHKVMLGYKSLKRAMKDYLSTHFDGHGHERMKDVTELSIGEFKTWLKNGDLKAPISKQNIGTVVARGKDFQKSDTISASTGLSFYSQLRAPVRRRTKKRRKQGPRWKQLAALTLN